MSRTSKITDKEIRIARMLFKVCKSKIAVLEIMNYTEKSKLGKHLTESRKIDKVDWDLIAPYLVEMLKLKTYRQAFKVAPKVQLLKSYRDLINDLNSQNKAEKLSDVFTQEEINRLNE